MAHDPLVAVRCPLPRFFDYLPTSRRRTPLLPPAAAPANPRAVVPSAWAACACGDCFPPSPRSSSSSPCPCRADVELGLSAIARGGPDAVVLLVECGGQCACARAFGREPRRGGGGATPGRQQQQQQQQQQQRLACRPTQGGCAFRVAVAAAPGAKGRGLFAGEAIPAGAFVLEYAGEALTTDEAAARLAEYDEARRRWRQRAKDQEEDEQEAEEEPGGASGHALLQIAVHGRMTPGGVHAGGPYCLRASIDATARGNAARFVNHSCAPNLGAVLVTGRRGAPGEGGDHDDDDDDDDDLAARAEVPLRVALFSRRAIADGEELTMSYGSSSGSGGSGSSGSGSGGSGASGAAPCECGEPACGGWLPSGA